MLYRLIKDEDGHWYIIPVEKESEFEKYLEKIYNDEIVEYPEWLTPVNGYHSVAFSGYKLL